MAHPNQQKFCEDVKNKFPDFFEGIKVLDVGSLDVNGNNQYLFKKCTYIGLDVAEGKNVDVVSIAHKYNGEEASFDVVLSTNALEHDMYYKLTLKKMVSLLKPRGLMFFSVAYLVKEHGTKRRKPSSSNTSLMNDIWSNYYKNLKPQDIMDVLNFDEIFSIYNMEIFQKDLRFWGIKK